MYFTGLFVVLRDLVEFTIYAVSSIRKIVKFVAMKLRDFFPLLEKSECFIFGVVIPPTKSTAQIPLRYIHHDDKTVLLVFIYLFVLFIL